MYRTVNLRATVIKVYPDEDRLIISGCKELDGLALAENDEVRIRDSPVESSENGESGCGDLLEPLGLLRLKFIDQKIFLITDEESFCFFRMHKGTFYLSSSPRLLAQFGCTKNAYFEKYFTESGGLYHPRCILVNEIGAVSSNNIFSAPIFKSDDNYSWELKRDYVKSFHDKVNVEKSVYKYSTIARQWIARRCENYKFVITKQSGMDSALVSLLASTADKDKTESAKFISLHCDLSGRHYLGKYQKSVASTISSVLNQALVTTKPADKEDIEISQGDLPYVIPKSAMKSWTIDYAMHRWIERSLKGPALFLMGDRTSLYQHFNGTLEYRLTLLTPLIGGIKRLLHGRWGASVLFNLTKFNCQKNADRYALTSYALFNPSNTGGYTSKMPSFVTALRGGNEVFDSHFYGLIKEMASDYLVKTDDAQLSRSPAVFHSIMRDQLIYALLMRNHLMDLPSSARVTHLPINAVNSHISLNNQPFKEVWSPKKAIRSRLLACGFGFDRMISAVDVPKGVRKKHFRTYIGSQIRLIKSILKRP